MVKDVDNHDVIEGHDDDDRDEGDNEEKEDEVDDDEGLEGWSPRHCSRMLTTMMSLRVTMTMMIRMRLMMGKRKMRWMMIKV